MFKLKPNQILINNNIKAIMKTPRHHYQCECLEAMSDSKCDHCLQTNNHDDDDNDDAQYSKRKKRIKIKSENETKQNRLNKTKSSIKIKDNCHSSLKLTLFILIIHFLITTRSVLCQNFDTYLVQQDILPNLDEFSSPVNHSLDMKGILLSFLLIL
jgi:hypothetical protein